MTANQGVPATWIKQKSFRAVEERKNSFCFLHFGDMSLSYTVNSPRAVGLLLASFLRAMAELKALRAHKPLLHAVPKPLYSQISRCLLELGRELLGRHGRV